MVKSIPMSAEAQKEAEAALAKESYVLPWMIDDVTASLQFDTDRAGVHRMLEDCKGDVDLAVSKLLDGGVQSSSSSRRGSSSVEREPDSDDDSYSGPKKKQDRRLSRAKRTHPKVKDEDPDKYLSPCSKGPNPCLTQHSSSISELNSIPDHTGSKDADETDEEDWFNNSPRKDSECASVSTSASEVSVASNTHNGAVRIKLSQPKKRDDSKAPQYTSTNSELPFRNDRAKVPISIMPQRNSSFRKHHMSRNQLDLMKKTQQKAAAKERKREAAAARVSNQPAGHFLPSTKKGKENTPVLETHIKVLYI